jgi:hypothetical protein
MPATSKPAPGSPAAVLDVLVHLVAEGRYRQARLHLLWVRSAEMLQQIADLVNRASAAPELPRDMTTAAVIEHGLPQRLPRWLRAPLTSEIERICLGRPVERIEPIQLVARVTGAVCIDLHADTLDAANRLELAEAEEVEAPARHRMLELDQPDVIRLQEERAGRSAG